MNTPLNKTLGAVNVALRGDNFLRLFISPERLKIELINDVPAHSGPFVNHPTLGVIDSKETILANKLTALADRGLPKDITDIYVLLNDGLSVKKRSSIQTARPLNCSLSFLAHQG